MNNWTFTGNLGKDCEQQTTAGGLSICTFSVAVKSGFGDKEKTTWVKCGLFGKRAEGGLPQYLVKGTQVCISGEMSLDQWEKDGVKNSMVKVNVDKLDLIGGNQQAQQQKPQQQASPQGQIQHPGARGGQSYQQPQQQPAPQQPQGFDDYNENIPF